jgi:hypothetical protein
VKAEKRNKSEREATVKMKNFSEREGKDENSSARKSRVEQFV